MAEFKELPTPTYNYETATLRSYYEKAMASVSGELNRLGLSNFERAQILATQADIKKILTELDGLAADWAAVNIEKSATDGVVRSLVALGLAETAQEAANIVRFNKLNRDLIKTAVADTQDDLLQISQNVDRKVRIAIRQAAAETMRSNLTQGINGTASLKRDLLSRLDVATKSGIIDASGRRWKPEVYAEMLVRTKMSRTHTEATINDALGRDVLYGIISSHGAKDACAAYENKIVKLVPDAEGEYPYYGDLPRRSIFHPNCKHVISPVRRPDRLPENLRKKNNIQDPQDFNSHNKNNNVMRNLTDEKEIVKNGGRVLKGNNSVAKLYGISDSEEFEYMLADKAKKALKGNFRGVAEVHFNLLDEWITDNNDVVGRSIENHFSKKFGLPYKLKTPKKTTKREEAVLDHMYNESLLKLKEQGVTHVKVYRGVGWNDGDKWMPEDKKDMSLNGRGLSSWAFNKSVAEDYAAEAGSYSGTKYANRGVLEAVVPIEKVAFLSGPGSNEEATIIGDIFGVNMTSLKSKRR